MSHYANKSNKLRRHGDQATVVVARRTGPDLSKAGLLVVSIDFFGSRH